MATSLKILSKNESLKKIIVEWFIIILQQLYALRMAFFCLQKINYVCGTSVWVWERER